MLFNIPLTTPLAPSLGNLGHRLSSASHNSFTPSNFKSIFFSSGILDGTAISIGIPLALAKDAKAIPVFPDEGSIIHCPSLNVMSFSIE